MHCLLVTDRCHLLIWNKPTTGNVRTIGLDIYIDHFMGFNVNVNLLRHLYNRRSC